MVCYGVFEGQEVLGLRMNFSKRWITLAPIATVIGLAFKLYDPDGLLGDASKTEYGITCALLPPVMTASKSVHDIILVHPL